MHTISYHRFFVFVLFTTILVIVSFNSHAAAYSCNTKQVDKFIEAEYVKSMNITTPKSRKWVQNYFMALRDGGGGILEKYKKKFDANIKVLFDNGMECDFLAKIRINGDLKDHLEGPPSVASLDVELLTGNIDSIVKFKLFLPHTRNGDNEILSTLLLRELGFLAPRTYYIPSNFNNQSVLFIFQEKIVKELIEASHLREAPILEGDERFWYANDITSFGGRVTLGRIVNDNWAIKGVTSLNISKTALSQLNLAYLEFLSGRNFFQNRNYRFLRVNALSHGEYIDKDREFKSIMVAIGAAHGLWPNNRRFYYDPIYKYFKSIYYDGNATITTLMKPTDKSILNYGTKLNIDEILGVPFAINSINKLDRKDFHTKLKKLGLNYTLDEVEFMLDRVIRNLKLMSTSNTLQDDNHYLPFFSNYKDINTNKKLIFSTEKDLRIEICNISLTSCQFDIISIKDYSKLLKGRYLGGSGIDYIFIGDKQGYVTGSYEPIHENENTFDIENGVELIAYGSLKVSINKESKKIELQTSNADDRVLLKGGMLKDWSIKFTGPINREMDGSQRFNQNLLTGCLTFLDMQVENINIDVNQASCEDSINLLRVNGNINNVAVNDALADAIDVDYSMLHFNDIKVNDAKNDCVDFSYGDYYINNVNLIDCKDKAISVGEKSTLSVDFSQILSSNIGVAAKDSSIVKVNAFNANNVATCFSAYNKKQEFWGGRITVGKHNCHSDQVFQQEGSLVEFVQ